MDSDIHVTFTGFDGLIVSVYCRNYLLVSERWYGHGRTGRTGSYGPAWISFDATEEQS